MTLVRTDSEEKFEETKGVIRIRKSKDRQHNGEKNVNKKTNNNLQNTTQKTKDIITYQYCSHVPYTSLELYNGFQNIFNSKLVKYLENFSNLKSDHSKK